MPKIRKVYLFYYTNVNFEGCIFIWRSKLKGMPTSIEHVLFLFDLIGDKVTGHCQIDHMNFYHLQSLLLFRKTVVKNVNKK